MRSSSIRAGGGNHRDHSLGSFDIVVHLSPFDSVSSVGSSGKNSSSR
jgi:hypothetical protein